MDARTRPPARLKVTLIGGPTVLLELGGVRFLTDPTFDPPGSYEPRPGVHLTKTAGPALTPERLLPVDAVLLSHDHHKDNLDDLGRKYLDHVKRVFTTIAGAERLGKSVTPLANWESIDIERGDGPGSITVTGVPAQHGPDGSEQLVGEVTGFVLSGEDLPRVYVSGDNASLDVVRTIVARIGAVDAAVLFLGGAQMPYLGREYLTLPSTAAPDAARRLGARTVIPVHVDGWAHFSDDRDSVLRAFRAAGLSHVLFAPTPGEAVTIGGAGPSSPFSAH